MTTSTPVGPSAPSALARPETGAAARISSRTLTLYAVLVAAAGFIPIPIVDDLVPEQLVRHLVYVTLRTAGRTFPLGWAAPLYRGGGCLGALLELLVLVPIKLLLYPIRKFVVLIRAVRGLSRRTASTYLLGHAIARALERGWLPEGTNAALVREQSRLIRAAFDRTVERVNPLVFSQSLTAVLGGLRGVGVGAWRSARALLRRDPTAGSDPENVAAASPAVGAAVDGVQDALGSDAVTRYLTEFEVEFDRAVEELLGPAPPGAAPPPPAPASDAPVG